MNPKKPFYSLFVLCLLLSQWALADPDANALIERRKTVVKLYDVSQKDNLLIDNQFGNVKINLWDRNEIRVDISITANGATDERVQRYLDAVEITERRNGDQISLKTVIEKGTFNGNVNWKGTGGTWSNNEREKNGLQIDYQVSMPKNNALTVRNQFGNTTIPTFTSALSVNNKFGSFYATDLKGSKIDIDVAFGTAEIGEVDNAKLDISYSKLTLEKANVLTLNNKYGKMQIGEVNRLDANIGYSGAQIGTLKESCKVKLDFSGGFKIQQLPKSAENVDIQAAYSSVVLPVNDDGQCQFDVTVQHGGFRYPTDNRRVVLTTQPSDDHTSGPRFTKQYSGKVGGSGPGPRIRVVSKFGDVSFR